MASLKDYLRNFAKASSHFASFGGKSTTYTPVLDNGGGQWGSIVSPGDGVVSIDFNYANLDYFDLQNQTTGIQSCTATLNRTTGACFVPCAKGDQIRYHLGTNSGQPQNPSAVTVRFVPSLGSQ